MVAKSVENSVHLQVFDISFNNVGCGSNENMKTANALKSLFLNNKTLVHVDISHCKLTVDELKIMSKYSNLI
jgi:hypothetical protein